MRRFSFTFLGHSTFLFETTTGKRVIVDPWLETNPQCPASLRRVRDLDLMLLTHGHRDHIADAVPLARSTGAQAIAPYELAAWLETKGLKRVSAMNLGGTLTMIGLSITMVPAVHSSSIEEVDPPRYAGVACGYVIRFEHGLTIYYAGDTALFGDMRVIGELYRPSLAFLPIGDVYTMGPEQAAKACEWLGVTSVVPMHYATFPELSGTPARLRELLAPSSVKVIELAPGEQSDFTRT
jgi:L-ascorbate metabolism protein UlaG (beta-lactamase superfamily)